MSERKLTEHLKELVEGTNFSFVLRCLANVAAQYATKEGLSATAAIGYTELSQKIQVVRKWWTDNAE